MKRTICGLLVTSFLLISCNRPKPVVIGSKSGPEQALIGEIVAQHLEHRIGTPVERRLNFGDTQLMYQSLLNGDVTVYPDYTGLLQAEVLKEMPSTDASIVYERVRSEMARVAMVELTGRLGFDNRTVMVVRASDSDGIDTLTQAAAHPEGWKLGVTYEFQSRAEGLPALNAYRLPMAAAFRSMDAGQLFPSLEQSTVNMIAAQAGDGHLRSPEWKILEDDRQVFSPQEAVLLVRQDAFSVEPGLQAALSELSGILSLEKIRQLNAEILTGERTPADVVREFLASAGL